MKATTNRIVCAIALGLFGTQAFAGLPLRRSFNVAAIVLAIVCLHAAAGSAAHTVAETGFNDASGINSNPLQNSPYTLNSTVAGQGAGEPGWVGNLERNIRPLNEQQSAKRSDL